MSDNQTDVLEGGLDDLMDMPEFKAWPNGSYLVVAETKFEEQELENDDTKPLPVITYKFQSVIELANSREEIGDMENAKFSRRCYLYKRNGEPNAGGQGEFKMFLAAVKHLYPQAKTNSELFEMADGSNLAITVKLRRRKYEGEIREENQVKAISDPDLAE